MATSQDTCALKAQSSYSCVFLDGACQVDPCLSANTTECKMWAGSKNCIPTPYLPNFQCVSYEFLCNRIPLKNCLKFSMCARKSEAFCGYAIPKGQGTAGTASSECTPFPLWSIALLVLWLFIMLILIAIIVLALKRKQSGISGVESSKVEVDQVAIREDNFIPSPGLDQRLVTNAHY
jgi:hypothetical protein